MKKIDYKKELKHLYQAKAKHVLEVDVPHMNFLMIDGKGDPNTSQSYADAVEALDRADRVEGDRRRGGDRSGRLLSPFEHHRDRENEHQAEQDFFGKRHRRAPDSRQDWKLKHLIVRFSSK